MNHLFQTDSQSSRAPSKPCHTAVISSLFSGKHSRPVSLRGCFHKNICSYFANVFVFFDNNNTSVVFLDRNSQLSQEQITTILLQPAQTHRNAPAWRYSQHFITTVGNAHTNVISVYAVGENKPFKLMRGAETFFLLG